MEEIGTSFGTKLAECLWDPISRHARYLFCFNKFNGDVKEAKRELEVKMADVNKRKEEADRKTEEIMPSVKKWLEEVNAILEEVQKLQHELEGGGNKCFNVSLRYSLAKQMEDKANKMKELKSNSSFEPFSQLIPLPTGIDTQFSSKEVMDFKSRKSTFNSLLEAIKDGKNKMVGLYGMGGSGKTTLAIEVGKKVEQLNLFDNVVKVVVSQPLNVRNIQEEIKRKTGLKFEESTDSTNAQRIIIGLRSKKVLIILDDVWRILNLQEIGIPPNENCRILLTTRFQHVCDSMHCERTFKLSTLIGEEAQALLMMHANLTNDSFNELDDVGRKIVDECKGLPIAIVTVGRALRGKGIADWKSALWRLQHSVPLDVDESSRGPFACLELSYDSLPSLAKQLFLLCSMFPEDHEIHQEDLIRFSKGTLKFEEIVENIAYTMEVARNEILVSIHRLLDSCLLMHTDKQACVKMHDLVRDVALWITKKKDQAILVNRHEVSKTLIENETLTLKKTKAISLWNLENNFKLSNQLHCPTLEILLLHSDEGFIEDLGGIESLKVLALITFSFDWSNYYYWVWIQRSMSQSIVSSLENLHTLCFRGITLGDISFLCHLKRLEILDLRGSQFDELPGGIVEMRKLKLLDVFGCAIEKSPLEVIQKCELLEELYFLEKKSAIPKNFSLSRLERYVIYDSTSKIEFSNDHPSRFFNSCDEPLRALCIQGFKVFDLNSSMKNLILRANFLCLENCMWDHKDINVNIKHLLALNCPEKRFIVDSFGTDVLQTRQVFPHLITLELRQMNSLEQVFQDSSVICSLPMLQELDITECPKLTTIFPHATSLSLPKLRTLGIYGCNKVKWLFSYSLAVHCPSLEKLTIAWCDELERLIQEEVAHGDHLLHQRESHHDLPNYPYTGQVFPMLQELYIQWCSKLTTIFPHATSLSLPKLRTLYIRRCDKVKWLFSYSLAVHCPSLEELEISSCDELERLIQEEVAHVDHLLHQRESHHDLPNYPYGKETEKITKRDCSEPESLDEEASHEDILLPLLLQLKHLSLVGLPKLREIFGGRFKHKLESLHNKQEYSSHKHKNEKVKIVNLELISINLQVLPEWDYIWKSPTQSVSLHRLEEVTLQRCPKLKNIFTFAIITNLPELWTLIIEECEEWERIFCEESLKNLSSSIVCLPKLKRIRIFDCHKVRRLFSYALASHCPSLEEITIWNCSQLEGVVLAYEGEVAYHHEKLFLNMNDLDLKRLPKLREIYPNYEFNHLSGTIRIEDCPNICNIPL